ncbi:MAG: 4-hydroxy-tetrahydrodipicolinate reductase [Chromatiales bacterium]|jgi:4-hydroxy-tetrahydrodipicolinate reductase|nr:4-hydroxy-tetrahydrodipicolinate reductase [Chromatiales bacterium]
MRGVTVLGANGRMGQALVRLLADHPRLRLAGALTEPGHAAVGRDAGELAGIGANGVRVTDRLPEALANTEVVIDFTAAAATPGHVLACAERGLPVVVGTTGIGGAGEAALKAAAVRVAVVYSRNMSLGITVLTELAAQAARLLGPGFDIEVVEAHHRHKVDAPSGTALQLGEAVAAARHQSLADVRVDDRSGARPAGGIGFASIRAGAIVGDHSVLLVGEEETLELRHHAADRALFARGALRAADWVIGRPAGLYGMRDVLGL